MTAIRRSLLAAFGPLFFLLFAAAVAALLAYPIFRLSGSGDISLFRTLVSRGGQILLLLGIYPLAKWLGLAWSDFGWRRDFPRQWLIGFVLGTSMLALHVLALIGLEIREVNESRLTLALMPPLLLKALAVGVGVALLEESLFRGALVGVLRRVAGPVLAVAVSAAYYAGLHFIGTKWATALDRVGWDTGFRIALDGFSHLLKAPPDAVLGLFVAGLMLACLRVLMPLSLGLCVGLHSGWVFIIVLTKTLTQVNWMAPQLYLVSHYDFVVGYLSAAWLGVLLVLILAGFARHQRRASRLALPTRS